MEIWICVVLLGIIGFLAALAIRSSNELKDLRSQIAVLWKLDEDEKDEPTPFFASELVPYIRQFNTSAELQKFLIDEQIRACDIDEIKYLGGQISVIYVKGDT